MSWEYFNPNPVAAREEDCAVRAVSAALGISWDKAFDMIAHNAKQMGAMMHRDAAWGSVLRQHGFRKKIIPNVCPDCFTAEDFCQANPRGIFVLGFGNHTACVIDGVLLDTWQSSDEIPIYVWYKKEV
jgi:hypothetical protein